MKTALIAGSSGLIGGSLIQYLLESDNYKKVISMVRRPSNLSHPKLDEQIIDFDQLNRFFTQVKVDDVFCCLGTTIKTAGSKEAFTRVDYTYVCDLASWAKDHQCKLFSVVSSVGAKAETSNFYLRTKGQMEACIAQSEIPSIHIFRPSLLLGQRNEFRFGEKLSEKIMKILNPIMIGSLRKYRAIQAKEVAKAMYNQAQTNIRSTIIFEGAEIK